MKEIEKNINEALANILTDVARAYLVELMKFIEKYVYRPNVPSQYERTFEFLNAFEYKNKAIKTTVGMLQEIYFKSGNLSKRKQSNGFIQHEYKDKMAEILNSPTLNRYYSQAGGALNINQGGLYWDEFIKYVEKNFKRDFISTAKKYGLKLTAI